VCDLSAAVAVVFGLQNSMGLVYIKFEAVAAGAAALNSLNGRWFAGKMISAEFYNEAQYNAKFGL
jgi:RNA-binding protein 39